MEAVILMGIQASGKSTFYRRCFQDTHVRVNLDMLRTRRREDLIMRACLEGETRFVLDNTNVTREERARYIRAARERRFRVIGYYFASSPGDCLERNAEREGKARIPDKGLLATFNRLELPRFDEGFDQLYYVRLDAEAKPRDFVVEQWNDEIH